MGKRRGILEEGKKGVKVKRMTEVNGTWWKIYKASGKKVVW